MIGIALSQKEIGTLAYCLGEQIRQIEKSNPDYYELDELRDLYKKLDNEMPKPDYRGMD